MSIKSIRAQFYMFVVGTLLIMLVLLNTYPIISTRDAIFEEKQSSLSGMGSTVSTSLARLDSLTADNIREVLKLFDLEDYSRIVVADAEGTVVYDSAGSAGADGTMGDIQTALAGKTVFRSLFADSAFQSSYATPMSDGGETVGVVFLSQTDTERAQVVVSLKMKLRIIGAVICTAVVILCIFYSGFVLKRIKSLSNSMKIVADGDYSYRMDVRGSDEIASLGNEFNALTERLDNTERQRRRFVSDASHELKTPLASIRLLADSIVQNESMDRDTMLEFVSDIGSESERLQHTTENLLALSRFDDDVAVVPEPVDVYQVALDTLVIIKPLADSKNITVDCELDDGCVVMATQENMFHIIFNLMENAVKYNTEGGSVSLKLHSTDDEVILSVADTGIGIPEEERLNIFGRFYRVDKARSREAGGSGLGLSIVHDAVLSHKGRITVGANKPRGSIFTVSFPKPDDEETGI